MSDLDFEAFSKKYSFAINGLEMRAKSSKSSMNDLAEKLYQDSMANKINMDDLTMELRLFYQGNVFGQTKINNYIERYKGKI